MKYILTITSIAIMAIPALADTATYNLTGLHCGGCKAAIEASVCKGMKDISSCSVESVDQKKQTGKLSIVTKDGVKIDDTKVTELVSKAGEYKAVRSTATSKK